MGKKITHSPFSFHSELNRNFNFQDETKPFYSTHFLKRFLSCITQVMGEIDNPSTVYTFEYDAKLGKVTHRGLEGRNQHTFVADWFRLMLDDRLEDAHELQRMNN